MKESGGDPTAHRQMKLFTALATAAVALAGFAAPEAKALPVWAEITAQSHCEYLAMGATWKQASTQALQDNIPLWKTEMQIARNNGLFGKTVSAAVSMRCASLEQNAFNQHKAAKNSAAPVQAVQRYVRPNGEQQPGCTDPSIGPATKKVMGCI